MKGELIKLIAITCKKEGCNNYDLHQDSENPGHFMFYESWDSRELWQTHIGAPHLQAYVDATGGKIAEFIGNEMSIID